MSAKGSTGSPSEAAANASWVKTDTMLSSSVSSFMISSSGSGRELVSGTGGSGVWGTLGAAESTASSGAPGSSSVGESTTSPTCFRGKVSEMGNGGLGAAPMIEGIPRPVMILGACGVSMGADGAEGLGPTIRLKRAGRNRRTK